MKASISLILPLAFAVKAAMGGGSEQPAVSAGTAISISIAPGLHVTLPREYTRFDRVDGEPLFFVRRGVGRERLRKVLPNVEFDETFLDDWFFDGVSEYVILRSIPLRRTDAKDVRMSDDGSCIEMPSGTEPEAVHRFMLAELKSTWDASFSFYDPDSGVGRFVNYAGAFVAVHARICGDRYVMVEAMDLVEELVAEEHNSEIDPETDSTDALWEYYRSAANTSAADAVLGSMRQDSTAKEQPSAEGGQ